MRDSCNMSGLQCLECKQSNCTVLSLDNHCNTTCKVVYIGIGLGLVDFKASSNYHAILIYLHVL